MTKESCLAARGYLRRFEVQAEAVQQAGKSLILAKCHDMRCVSAIARKGTVYMEVDCNSNDS